MADSKKYDGSTWENAVVRKYGTASEIITPPTTIYTDGTAITTYTIKGNTVQNGTPTPSNPVPVVGVGELETTGEHSGEYKIPISSGGQTIDIYIGDLPLLKSLDGTAVDEISNGTLTRRVDSDGSVLPAPITTQITMPSIPTTDGANSISVDTTVQPSEFTATWTGWHDAEVQEYTGGAGNQKFDYTRTDGVLKNTYINQQGQMVENPSYNMSYMIQVQPSTIYTWNFASTVSHRAPTAAFYDSNENYISVAEHGQGTYFSFTTPNNCAYVRVPIYISDRASAMLNLGSEPLPYESYEYGWV